jgi:hypothetical protein
MRLPNLLLLFTGVLAAATPFDKQKRVKNFQWFGVNESGAEFGSTTIPGTLGKDYTWPVTYDLVQLFLLAKVLTCTLGLPLIHT